MGIHVASECAQLLQSNRIDKRIEPTMQLPTLLLKGTPIRRTTDLEKAVNMN